MEHGLRVADMVVRLLYEDRSILRTGVGTEAMRSIFIVAPLGQFDSDSRCIPNLPRFFPRPQRTPKSRGLCSVA
jgi:hypothetical protein